MGSKPAGAPGASPLTPATSDARPGGSVARKADHLRICLDEDVSSKGGGAGFDRYRFVHHALPDLDLSQVSTSTTLLGRTLAAPLLISCMTGGTNEARRINVTLAQAAATLGVAMGLGSGRVLLEHPEVADSFRVRAYAPDVLLFANLGAVQLNRGVSADDCRRLLDVLEADALTLHLNPLQEALQPDGDTCFAGLLPRIADLCRTLDRPVVVKEVGWGLAPDVVRALVDAGVSAIDVAGAGGTSWSEVERHRLGAPWRQRVAAAFAGWGIPTAAAVRAARRAAPEAVIVASGGIRDGIDVAKALALGANAAGLAGPFLRAAASGVDAAIELGREIVETLRCTMFCTGARSLDDLRTHPRLEGPKPLGPLKLLKPAELLDPADTPEPLNPAELLEPLEPLEPRQAGARRRALVSGGRHSEQLRYVTTSAGEFIDISGDVQAVVERSGIRDGQVHVFSRHTTAAIRINENEPNLLRDLREFLGRLVPTGGFLHDDLSLRVGIGPEEPRNGHAHARHLLLGASEAVPVAEGRLMLGTWQSLFLIELCSPRTRDVIVQVSGR